MGLDGGRTDVLCLGSKLVPDLDERDDNVPRRLLDGLVRRNRAVCLYFDDAARLERVGYLVARELDRRIQQQLPIGVRVSKGLSCQRAEESDTDERSMLATVWSSLFNVKVAAFGILVSSSTSILYVARR